MKDVAFFYDPISPYAHLAFERLPEALMGHSVAVRYKPVLFAALLKANGQLGPAEIPAKRDWTYRQVAWLAHHHGVALDLPAAHPFNPLPLLRLGLSCAMDGAPGETNRYVTEQLFHHVWRGGLDAADPARLAALQARLQDHMAQREKPWHAPDSDVVKQRLRANTDEALALGLFGVPAMVVDERVFWGFDALPMLRAYLDGDAWFQGGAWEAAAGTPEGVKRR
ncbi:MAG: 2-hydroxychromene-2-carboxylate isomerase [Hydrogenophaga sp.]|jgi:2-hydroxychromene-2-carboxylate isomerase|uniref:2-hydroxychromene-2-carboxylate isomerase n=1 Tax=Hydrogenophaga sp. TaxID=1904254 RepID=UPI00262F88B8|nr:2-hydroxychromene-2-carboxylate isomerase [Hydrogenophaga sp.]MCV0441172.1 2-hydroxychromene-2-carboxylate isomerase [Hydrogenophaga sp.]